MEQAATEAVESANIQTAGNNAAAFATNEARNAFFFDDEVLETINSFTFVNVDPQAQICKELAGRTFAKNDAEFMRFNPPLHHNCKSYLKANLTEKEIQGLPTITEGARKSITLGEC